MITGSPKLQKSKSVAHFWDILNTIRFFNSIPDFKVTAMFPDLLNLAYWWSSIVEGLLATGHPVEFLVHEMFVLLFFCSRMFLFDIFIVLFL